MDLAKKASSTDWKGIGERLGKPVDECKVVWLTMLSRRTAPGKPPVDEAVRSKKRFKSTFSSAKSPVGEPQTIVWSEEDDKKLFALYKQKGTKWSEIAKEFPGRNENQAKNRFYSTLRRIATQKSRQSPGCLPARNPGKGDLLQFVDEAMDHGHNCFTKRGRRKKCAVATVAAVAVPKKVVQAPVSPVAAPEQMQVHYRSVEPQRVAAIPPRISWMPSCACGQPPCAISYPSRIYVPPQMFRMGAGPVFGPGQPMIYQAGTTVNMQARLEEMANLQQSVINMLLNNSAGAAGFTEYSTYGAK